MTLLAQGQLLASVIKSYMNLAQGRIVLGSENFDGPKDSNLYVIVDYESPLGIVGVRSRVNMATLAETMSVTTHERWNVEVVSRDYSALNRHIEVYQAISSVAGTRAAEDNQCAFFRGGNPLNLTAIEGVSSLRRYRLPVIITNVQSKTSTVPVIDKFTTPEIKTEA